MKKKLRNIWPSMQSDGSVRLVVSYTIYDVSYIPAESARRFWEDYKSGKFEEKLRADEAEFNEQQDSESNEA